MAKDRDGVLAVADARRTQVSVAHQTISGLFGKYAPLSTHSQWAANPGGYSKARFYVDLALRGETGVANDPVITLRTYLRHGAYVGAGDSVSLTRPRLSDNAAIKLQKTADDGATYTDYSANVIDNSTATQADLDTLDTQANGDWFVVGGPVPFVGAAFDLDAANVNANASVLTVEYWDGAAWAAVASMTDGTIAVAGKTLSGDGIASWARPTGWAASTLNAIAAYYARFSVSAQLSANVDIEECDLLFPLTAAVDVEADGDDVMLVLESQDAVISGTLAMAGTTRVTWR